MTSSAPYDPRVERYLQMAEAAQRNRERFEIEGAELDLRDINWPALPHYGYDHAHNTMLLAQHVAQIEGVTRRLDLDAVKLAALFHDTGRRATWEEGPEADPHHRMRSVEAFKAWTQGKGTPTSLVDEVVFLIAHHDLSSREVPKDPRLVALWDADSFEAARFSPGTSRGAEAFSKRKARLVSAWAQERENQRKWMRHRGWSL